MRTRHGIAMLPEMVRLLITAFVIPLGLDLYMPVPEENPISGKPEDRGAFKQRGASLEQRCVALQVQRPAGLGVDTVANGLPSEVCCRPQADT